MNDTFSQQNRRLSFFERYFFVYPEASIGRLSYSLRILTVCFLSLITAIIYMLVVNEVETQSVGKLLLASIISLYYTESLALKLLQFIWLASAIVIFYKRINHIFGISSIVGKILKGIILLPSIFHFFHFFFMLFSWDFFSISGEGISFIYLGISTFLFLKNGNAQIERQVFDTSFSFFVLGKQILLFIVICPLISYVFSKIENLSVIQGASSKISQAKLEESRKSLLEKYGITENNLGKYESLFEEMPYSYFVNTLDGFNIILLNSETQLNSGQLLTSMIKTKARKYKFYKSKFDLAMKKSAEENYTTTTDIQSIPVISFDNQDCSNNTNNEAYEAVIASSKNQRLSCRLMRKGGYNYITTCTEYIKSSQDTFDVINYGQGDYGFATFGAPQGINENDRSNRYVVQGITKIGTTGTEGEIILAGNLYYLDLLEKKISSIPLPKIIKKNGIQEQILYFIDNNTVAIGKKELLPSNGEKEITSFGCSGEGKKIPYYSPKNNYKYTVTAEYNFSTGIRKEK